MPQSANVPGLEPGPVTAGGPHVPAASLGPGPAIKTLDSLNTESAASYAAAEPQPTEALVDGYRENPMFRNRRSGTPAHASGIMPRTSIVHPSPLANPIQRKALAPRPPSGLLALGGDARVRERPVTPTQLPQTSPTPHWRPDKTPSPGKAGHRPSSLSFSLTIIRRDPASETQCNVGKITSFHTNVPTPDSACPSLDPENMGMPHTHKIDIRLETSGYAKYRDMPSRASVDAYRPTSGHSYSSQVLRGMGPGPGTDKTAALKPATYGPVEEGFSRQVVMSYGPGWKSNLKNAFQRRDCPPNAGSSSPEDMVPARQFHTRHGSASTVGSVDSADGKLPPTLFTQPGPGLKPRGYVFLSPWDGRCEFRTSTNGRSLKCRHTIDPTSMKLDPREVAQNVRDAQAMGRSRGDELSSALMGAKTVSELRFNLPGGTHRPKVAGRDGGARGGRWDPSRLSGQFNKLLHHGSRSSGEDSDDDDDDYREHNNLGTEDAGGGNTGRRAKLGKLIIHDEGLKMLDLVVAANVGVWWATWGRTA